MQQKTILFICTGNTCRSAMAQGLAQDILTKKYSDSSNKFSASNTKVLSAGVFAGKGAPAAQAAVDVMRDKNIDITSHRSTPLTKKLINAADIIYTMTENHRLGVLHLEPGAADKTFNLCPAGDILDPVGMDKKTYQKTAKVLQECIEKRMEELQKDV